MKPSYIDEETSEPEEVLNLSSLKKLQPGDILDVVIKLRNLMSLCETTSYTLYSSFQELGGPSLEKEASKTRLTLELATNRLANLLLEIEKTPSYIKLKEETIARRQSKKSKNPV